MGRKRGNNRSCVICNFDVFRASFAKHLRSTKHLQNENTVPSTFLEETNQTKPKNYFELKPLKQIAGENIKKYQKELKEELA